MLPPSRPLNQYSKHCLLPTTTLFAPSAALSCAKPVMESLQVSGANSIAVSVLLTSRTQEKFCYQRHTVPSQAHYWRLWEKRFMFNFSFPISGL